MKLNRQLISVELFRWYNLHQVKVSFDLSRIENLETCPLIPIPYPHRCG